MSEIDVIMRQFCLDIEGILSAAAISSLYTDSNT